MGHKATKAASGTTTASTPGEFKTEPTCKQQQEQDVLQKTQRHKTAPRRSSRFSTPDVLLSKSLDQGKHGSAAAAAALSGCLQDSAAPSTAAADSAAAVTADMQQQQHDKAQSSPAAGPSCSGCTDLDADQSGAAAPTTVAAGATTGTAKSRKRTFAHKTCNGLVSNAAGQVADTAPKSKRQRVRQQPVGTGGDAPACRKPKAAGTKDSAGSHQANRKQRSTAAATSPAEGTAAATGKQPKAKKQKKQNSVHTTVDEPTASAQQTPEEQWAAIEQLIDDQITYLPARELTKAYLKEAKQATDAITAEEVQQAAPVVMRKDGKQPLWAEDGDKVKVHKGDVLTALRDRAVEYQRGQEPWRRFAGLPKQIIKKKNPDGSISVSEAAAGSAAPKRPAAKQDGGQPDAVVEAVLEARIMYAADQPFADPQAKNANAVKAVRSDYWKEFRLGSVTEAERVAERKADQENSKTPSARPDRVAESKLLRDNRAVNRFGKQTDTWGHLPGISINSKFMLRSEAHVLGAHKSPMTGIVSAEIPVPMVVSGEVCRGVKAATSIVMSGCYEDDHDATTDIVKYTGEGGNDLLGNKQQVKDQKLERGNKALLANIALGLPVRVFRRNDDSDSATNSVLFYDGLYDVVSWVKTLGKGGKVVYIYGLKRRTGQEDSCSKPIERFKGVGTAKKGTSVLMREHIICRDLSKGKEPVPVVVVNEVDNELPPGLNPDDAVDSSKWIVNDKGHRLVKSTDPFEYITTDVYDKDVAAPTPPVVAEEGSEQAVQAMAAELAAESAAATAVEGHTNKQPGGGRLRSRCNAAVSAGAVAAGAVAVNPSGTGGRPNGCMCWYSKQMVVRQPNESAHDLLRRLNWGNLPYECRTQVSKDKGPKLPVTRECLPILTECGDWTGCTDVNCEQRQGARGVQHRLEVFKTRDKGWGVRSWDGIKCGTLVCVMLGFVMKAEKAKYRDSHYIFDKTPRCWSTIIDASQQLDDKSKALLKDEKPWNPTYVLCAKEQGNVARFINHSCDPNLYVQPMCIGHTDNSMVAVGLFAAKNIPPFTELSYDYGREFIEHNLDGQCLCGSECCMFKPERQPAPASGQAGDDGQTGEAGQDPVDMEQD